MHLEELLAANFRSYTQLNARFHPFVNALVGNNGQGKTNVLDMIYFLGLCKSPSKVPDKSCIRHGEESLSLFGKYQTAQGALEVGISLQPSGKQIKHDGKMLDRISDHMGRIPVVAVYPHDIDLVNDGGEMRRRFMNAIISQYDPQFLPNYALYTSTLNQRNAMLRNAMPIDDSLLDVLDFQLARYADPIIAARKALIAEINPQFQECYRSLTDGAKEKVKLTYQTHLDKAPLEEQLRASRAKDKNLQHTTIGPHRDNLTLTLNGFVIKREGSQGQQKSYTVALRLAQFAVLKSHLRVAPILLLDDIFDRLDSNRVERLIDMLTHGEFGQIFVTDTDRRRVSRFLEKEPDRYNLYEAKAGELLQLS